MLHSLFILNAHGEVVLEKHWRAQLGRVVVETFWQQVLKATSPQEVLPVIATPRSYLVHIARNKLYFLAVVQKEMDPLLVVEFLGRVVEVIRDYYKDCNEEVVRENIITIYELLDEMMDNGYPFTTEPNILKEMIMTENFLDRIVHSVTGESNVSSRLPDGAVSTIQWRKSNVRYSSNEVFVDIIEYLDCIVDSGGSLVSSEINGEIQCNCRLSGMPDLSLVFQDPSVLDDCSFHPCVRFARYERDRVISFVPPDGQFKLLSYRSSRTADMPMYVQPRFSWYKDGAQVEIMVGMRHSFGRPVEDVAIVIPFPKVVQSVALRASVGSVHFDEISKTARWTIGALRQEGASLRGSVTLLPNETAPESNPVLSGEFKVNGLTLSGLRVASLTLVNEKYKPYKGVRSVSRSGNIQIRA